MTTTPCVYTKHDFLPFIETNLPQIRPERKLISRGATDPEGENVTKQETTDGSRKREKTRLGLGIFLHLMLDVNSSGFVGRGNRSWRSQRAEMDIKKRRYCQE